VTERQEGPAAIRTPDQRLRVFVSSTLAELAEERAAVAAVIDDHGRHMTVNYGTELFVTGRV